MLAPVKGWVLAVLPTLSVTAVLTATALVLPLGFAATPARAADVVDTIRGSTRLGTFADALEQAGMLETLRDEGPYTVFAPTNEAFAALPAATADALFAAGNEGALRELLGYHIVRGEAITAAELPEEVETESGTLYITPTDAGPTITRSERAGLAAAGGAEGAAPVEGQRATAAPGLLQDPEVTSPTELQDEEPQAQQEAAKTVEATGTTGQDAAAGILASVTELFGVGPGEGGGVALAEADVAADNGVVHVIEHVLVPDEVVEELVR